MVCQNFFLLIPSRVTAARPSGRTLETIRSHPPSQSKLTTTRATPPFPIPSRLFAHPHSPPPPSSPPTSPPLSAPSPLCPPPSSSTPLPQSRRAPAPTSRSGILLRVPALTSRSDLPLRAPAPSSRSELPPALSLRACPPPLPSPVSPPRLSASFPVSSPRDSLLLEDGGCGRVVGTRGTVP